MSEPQKTIKRKKKEPVDKICEACRTRNKEPVPDYACISCKEEQEKKGRRLWVSRLGLGKVHLGDMGDLGKQVPDHAVDMIFTGPPYIDELWEDAYRDLAELAARVLKPYGLLITYAPQAHLDEIIFILNHAGDRWVHGQLNYFWIISSINGGATCKAHKWNALCLHKPILVYQLIPDQGKIRGARQCFADVIRGKKQKAHHPWQQSVHDVLGIISRFMAPGEILLDPYAGTGTSLIAANLLGMEWLGFEIDPKTHAIAVREMQQRPVDLQAFGVEAEDATEQREPVPEQKDTSKQASIESAEISSKKRSRIDKPSPDIKAEPAACRDCHVSPCCENHDPHAGCENEALKSAEFDRDCIFCAVKMNCKHYGKPANNCLRKDPAPEPFVQHRFGTRGHHKGRKTFHESCPRLGELLFKGGTKSAKVLMDETAATPCGYWTDIPGDLYTGKKPEKEFTTVHYDGTDLSPSLGTCPDKCPYKVKEKSSCGFTDQGYLRMESCPTGILQGSPDGQKRQMENVARALARLSAHIPSEEECQCNPCPDGVIRCGIGDKDCPFVKEPLSQIALCPMTNPRRVRQILRERPLKFVKIEAPEEKIPNLGWCNARGCQELDQSSGICVTTGQKIKDMTYCPTQHLIREPKKKSASKKSKTQEEPES